MRCENEVMFCMLGLWPLLLLMNTLPGSQALLYKESIDIDTLSSFFGPDGCVEGSLVAVPTDVPIVTVGNQRVIDDDFSRTGTSESVIDIASQNQREDKDQTATDLIHMKEKTPMCLVNELARFNKIQHQYRLTSEQGPAHKKRFTVTLKLGDEEYTAEGASIKKAQHMAAAEALKATSYEHPPPKASRNLRLGKSNITPTVELNALAMKRGEPTVYTFVELPSFGHYMPPHNNYNYKRGVYTQVRPQFTPMGTYDYSRRNITAPPQQAPYPRFNQQRYYGAKGPSLYKVNVKVGEREFSGEGPTPQAARHDAAAKALDQLRNLPLDVNSVEIPVMCSDNIAANIEADSSMELKSPISLVHELALKRNLAVSFDVISEKGPPHMKTFVTRCRVGENFETTGEGNGKKVSKKRAAEKMLEQLRLLPPTTTVTAAGCTGAMNRMKRKQNPSKKKSRNLIKVTNPSSNQENNVNEQETEEINPISRLMQIQQAKKEREPVYTLLEERKQPRRREFFMQVTIGDHSFVGSGPNKKIAKRNAAEGLLQQLGYSSPPAGKQRLTSADVIRKSYPEGENMKTPVGGSGGRQLVPGVLLMTDNSKSAAGGKSNGFSPQHSSRMNSAGTHVNMQTTAAIAKEYLNGVNSPTAESIDGKSSHAVRPKEQLMYLAQLLGFRVQFSDFPKGNHSEFLSLVSLSTDPPQVCHGSGATTDLSHDQAALTALRALSEMGLDSVTPVKKETPMVPGEGRYLSKGGGNMANTASFVNGAPSK